MKIMILNYFSYNGTFHENKSTKSIHDGIKMTEYNNDPFLIGDFKHNKIEFFDLSHQQWNTASPYPYQNRIFGYGAVSRPGQVFIIGGCCSHKWSLVSLFENDKWSKIGFLNVGRMNFMTIEYGSDIMIFGGRTKNKKP